MKQTNILGLGLLVTALASCQVKVAEVEPASGAATASIVGVWSTDCIADSSDSYIKSFEVKDGTMTLAILRYQGTTTCDQASLGATIMQSGPLTITDDSTTITAGKNYEWLLTAAVVVPNSASITSMLNGANACGSSSWVINQAGLIFGCAVGGGFDLTQVNFNTVHYGVFAIEAAATPNYLHFEAECALAGYEDFCPSLSDRPSTLSGTVYFRR